jgi:hypothetical protein
MTVWTVHSGSYSDRGLDGIFSTKELAEALIKKKKTFGPVGYDSVDDTPEEWTLDTQGPMEFAYYVYHDGNTEPYKNDIFDRGFKSEDFVFDVVIWCSNVIVRVRYNEDMTVMEKAAIDKYNIWKAATAGLS